MDKPSRNRTTGNRPTLRDIAEEVGVTITTASFVLNGARSGTRVSDQTRAALLDAAKRLGYRPNRVARSLVRQKSGVIAIYSSYEEINAKNFFFAEIMGGLQVGCANAGVDLLIHTAPPGTDNDTIADSLLDGRADGVIVHSASNHHLPHLIAQSGIPAVAIADKVEFMPSVVVDDDAGGRLQARYLHESGHQKVLYRPAFKPFASTLVRQIAFTDEAGKLGLEVVVGKAPLPRQWAGLTEEEKATLGAPDRPTAIVCWEDMTAYQTIIDLDEMEIDIPREVAVVGFNGVSYDFGRRRRLTTIDAHWALVAETAVGILMKVIAEEPAPRETVLPVEMVVGASS